MEISETTFKVERDGNKRSPTIIKENDTNSSTRSHGNPNKIIITTIQEPIETTPESEKGKMPQFKLTVFFVSFIASLDAVIVGACFASVAQDSV